MGNNNSSRGRGNSATDQQPPSTTATTPAQSQPEPKPATTTTATPKKLDPCDVVISATPSDKKLVDTLQGKIHDAGYTVYSNTSTNEEDTRTLSRMLVDAKLLVFVMSNESVRSNTCSDQVSLAYISNKPILLAARKKKDQLMPTISFGLKLTLQNLIWTVFETDTPDDSALDQFINSVKTYQSPVKETTEVTVEQPLESAPPVTKPNRMRINTKLHSEINMEVTETVVETFWERNFGDDESVQWFRFQQAFLTDYDSQLKELFPESQIPWLLEMLKVDIFGGADNISKSHFYQVRGESKDRNTFWKVISQIAVERFNMQEVFNMQSTVRLTAVESLGKFHNPAVVEALIRLLDDEDANVRAVAAISLGRTGVQDETVIDKLIAKTKDGDRIVRQSVCLSLGALKAKKAIPYISNLWRNDFISVVRDAARTALQKMNVPEAEEVLKVTRILEDEIKHLEGNISSV